uniref:C2 domain-containing protein n=1 Tax=Timema genevievae TaxID=629358 RepID=A0A7R9JRN8_TIMGE|nr:unnamed protein product [Timema genevievae]
MRLEPSSLVLFLATYWNVEQRLQYHKTDTERLVSLYYLQRLQDQANTESTEYGVLSVRAYFNHDSLCVEVLNARDVIPLDPNGFSDPFVIIELLPRKVFAHCAEQQTNVQKKTLNPMFDECFEFSVTLEQCRSEGAMILFTVMDHDVLTFNDFAGEAFLALGSIPGVADNNSSIDNFHGLKQVDLNLMHQKNKSKCTTAPFGGRSLLHLGVDDRPPQISLSVLPESDTLAQSPNLTNSGDTGGRKSGTRLCKETEAKSRSNVVGLVLSTLVHNKAFQTIQPEDEDNNHMPNEVNTIEGSQNFASSNGFTGMDHNNDSNQVTRPSRKKHKSKTKAKSSQNAECQTIITGDLHRVSSNLENVKDSAFAKPQNRGGYGHLFRGLALGQRFSHFGHQLAHFGPSLVAALLWSFSFSVYFDRLLDSGDLLQGCVEVTCIYRTILKYPDKSTQLHQPTSSLDERSSRPSREIAEDKLRRQIITKPAFAQTQKGKNFYVPTRHKVLTKMQTANDMHVHCQHSISGVCKLAAKPTLPYLTMPEHGRVKHVPKHCKQATALTLLDDCHVRD